MLGFKDTSTLVGILCLLPEKGRKEIVNEREGGTEKKEEQE